MESSPLQRDIVIYIKRLCPTPDWTENPAENFDPSQEYTFFGPLLLTRYLRSALIASYSLSVILTVLTKLILFKRILFLFVVENS